MNKQVKVIPRRDRVEKWEYYNPILKRQELVKVFFTDGTERWKIGDGKTHFVDLPVAGHSCLQRRAARLRYP